MLILMKMVPIILKLCQHNWDKPTLQPEEEAEEEHGNSVKIEITCITPVLQAFLDFYQISLAFNMFSTLVLVEVKLSGN